MSRNLIKLMLLLLLLIMLAMCKKEITEHNGLQRPQFERLIFNKSNPSESDLDILHQMRDKGENFAYFRELPDIRGFTAAGESNLFLVNFIIAYDFRNRRLGLELSQRNAVIVDRVRNRLSQLSVEDFAGHNEEELRTIILDDINPLLRNGQADDILFRRIEIYPIPHQIRG